MQFLSLFTQLIEGSRSIACVRHEVRFTFQQGDEEMGTVTFGIFTSDFPIASQSFLSMVGNDSAINYARTPLHRIIPGFGIQGGDWQRGDGRGGQSGYVDPFQAEPFQLQMHRYSLGAVGRGENEFNGQFIIGLGDAPWAAGDIVVFGQVVDGFQVIDRLERIKTDMTGKPLNPAIVSRTEYKEVDEYCMQM